MIIGVGTDIVSVARIEAAMAKERFLEKLFSKEEQRAMTSPERVAGRWAAKEAVAKALSTSLTWQDVEILNDEEGKPFVRFADSAQIEPEIRVSLSISHEREFAVAFVVAERP